MIGVSFEDGLGLVEIMANGARIEKFDIIIASDFGKFFFASFDWVAEDVDAESNHNNETTDANY